MLRRVVLIAGVVAVLGSVAATASAQGFRGGMSGRGASAMLLAMPEVQKELNLNDDQAKQVNTLLTDTREKLQSSFGRINFQELQNLSDEERQQRFNEMRKKAEEVTKGIDEKINQILDAKQTQRLSQLQLQREGAMALARPEVAKKLNLTEEQQAKIKQIQEAARPTGRNFNRNMSSEDRQKMREQFEKAQKDSLAVLDDDQMLDWTNMCGKTFKFPERQGFRGNRPAPPPQ